MINQENPALRQALELAASNWSKKAQWVEDNLATWSRHPAVAGADPGVLDQAMLECMAKLDYPPKLKEFLGFLGEAPGARACLGAQPTACSACRGSRWIEAAVWREELALVVAVACPDCSGGLPVGTLQARWYGADSRITKVIFGKGRPLTAEERGETGKVLTFRKSQGGRP